MIIKFEKFTEKNTYHSLNDIYNLAEEIRDFVYNKDVLSTDYFKFIKKTGDDYIISFSLNGNKLYKINKEKVTDNNKEINIDEAYYNLDILFNTIQDNLYSFNIQQIDENVKSFNKEALIEFYKEICKLENVNPIPIKFGVVGKLGGVLVYNSITKKPDYIKFDMNKLLDIEYTLYHEFAHQICLIKYQDPGHGSKFKKEFNRINDKYMYSRLSMKYMEKIFK